MSVSTTQELESEISQMEERLATVKVVVDVEREAWRRSSRTGKRGTKWKGAAPSRHTDVETPSSPTGSATHGWESGGEGAFAVMPVYWDALELAQYLQTKQLTNYAQVVVSEQITGKMLLDTAANKLRQLFPDVAPSASDPEWKTFLAEWAKLHKQQRRLEKVSTRSNSGQEATSSRKSDSQRSGKTSQSVIGAAGAALVFPLISPRLPVLPGSGAPRQQRDAKAATPRAALPPRKPASTQNLPMATCWNCRTRFFRPHSRKPSARAGTTSIYGSGSSSSSMKASLSGRMYCSKACQASIESGDMRISPSLSARVKVTFHGSDGAIESSGHRGRPFHGAAGVGVMPASNTQVRDTLVLATGGTSVRPVGPAIHCNASLQAANRPRRKSETHARRPAKRKVTVKELEDFDFLHVAAPKGKVLAFASSPHRHEDSRSCTPGGTSSHAGDAAVRRQTGALAATKMLAVSSANAPLAITSSQLPGAPNELLSVVATHAKPAPPASLMLRSSEPHGALRQCKIYRQSKYKLDPELFQANQESFSSCFGAVVASSRAADHARGNLLQLQKFLTVRALHRLSLTSRAWFDVIATPSALSDALWGVHVLRIWRPSTADEVFLHDINVLTKPERPRRMLHKLTRQVARVVLNSMKVLLNPESWQLASVMTPAEVQDIQTLNCVLARAQRRLSSRENRVAKPKKTQQQHGPAELYEHITAIYTRSGEIVAVSARQLIRPVDPAAPLTEILQGLRNGELSRVHCRRLRLFSQANPLPFDHWSLLPAWAKNSRAVVELFWPAMISEEEAITLPVWHQKSMSRLQHALQQRLLSKDSVHTVTKSAHEQNAPPAVLLALEKFLTRYHAAAASANGLATSTPESNGADPL